MSSFQYQALRISDKKKVSGVINAATEKEARELLRDQDLIPTQMSIVAAKGLKFSNSSFVNQFLQMFSGVGLKEKIIFTRNMEMMIRAGIPLTDALLYFENYAPNKKLKNMTQKIRKNIVGGNSFSKALAMEKDVFDDVYVNVVKAGEDSGELEKALGRLSHLLEGADKLKMKIITASVYPVIVLVIVGLVMLILFIVVLPTFADIYKKMGVKLPLLTQVFMFISDFLRNYWFISFPALFVSFFGMFRYFSSPTGQGILDVTLLKVPVLGNLITYINNAMFVSTFSISFNAGLPITDALSLSIQTIKNTVIRKAFQKVSVKIQAGQRLAQSLSETGHMPDLVLLLISTGEESGELDRMLETSCDYLDEEINHKVGILTSMMEPAMLLVLGVVVGLVCMAIYMPMFSIYDHI